MQNNTIDELKSAWNAQADRMNKWDELGLDEIVDFAQTQLLNRIAGLEALRASPVYGRLLKEERMRIVAATVEACLRYVPSGHYAADAIRAITPKQILSGLAASQQSADRIADSGTTIDAQSGEKQ